MSLFLRIAFAGIAGAAWLCAAVPVIAKPPVVLTPTFEEKASGAPPVVPQPVCKVNFTELKDERRDPTMVGVIGSRAVQSPQDTQAWIKAVLGGLTERGVSPQFDMPTVTTAGDAPAPTARVSLQMVWINSVAVNFSANVIFAVDTSDANGHTMHQTYRGRTANMNWWGTSSELQQAINFAFADALNKMAPDLRQLCQA